jgi:hypothetical protein
MTYIFWLFLGKHLRTLSAIVYSCVGICLVCAAYWGAQSMFMLPQIKAANAAVKTKKSALLVSLRNVQDQKLVETSPAPSADSQTVSTVETELENFAHEEGCKVAQFSAQPTATAYTSHFGGSGDGYEMYNIKFTLNGNLSNVLATLQELSDGPVPFEFGSINFTPITTSDSKAPANQVSAMIEVDPVAKQGASK